MSNNKKNDDEKKPSRGKRGSESAAAMQMSETTRIVQIIKDCKERNASKDEIIDEIEKSPEARLLPDSIKHQINRILTIIEQINDSED